MGLTNTKESLGREGYIALGSNLGDRFNFLKQALEMLHAQEGIEILRISNVYETDPVGYEEQPAFLNLVAAVRSVQEPLVLLRNLLAIEQQLGRIRSQRFGPRTIDLDFLLYDNVIMDEKELTLPHPRMMERLFVLVPLQDIIADQNMLQKQLSALSQAALQTGKDGVTLWKTTSWHKEYGLLEN